MRKIFITLLTGIFLCLNYANAQLTVSMSSSQVNMGTQATVDVTVNGFTNILGVQFSINYDSLVLSYANVANFAVLPGLSSGTVSGPNGVGVKNGQITFSWFDNDGTGKTLPAGSRLFSIVFNAIGPKGSKSDVVTSNTPRTIEVIQVVGGNLTPINLINNKGTVTINGDPPPSGCVDPACSNPNALTFTGAVINTQKDQTICVPITVKNFKIMQSGQGSIKWDPAILQYTEVKIPTTGGIPGFGGGFNTANTATGEIKYLWFNDTPGTPLTLPDNTVIMELCFKVLGNAGQTGCVQIGIGSLETLWEDDNGNIPLCFSYGKVNIIPPTTNPVIIKTGTGSGKKGDTVCVDITVDDFTNIFAFQTTFSWNPAQLKWLRTEMYDLDGLNSSAFNSDVNNGTLKVAWTNGNSVTKPKGHRIFKICFELLCPGTAAYTAQINVGSTDVTGSVNGTPTTVASSANGGSIAITCDTVPPPMVTCTVGTSTAPDCNGGTNGSITVTVANATNDCVFQWKSVAGPAILKTGLVSSGNLNLTGVGAGTYTFDVLCSGVLKTTCQATIVQPPAIVIPSVGVVTNVSCSNRGAINITATSGGTGGLTYTWNPTQGNTGNPTNLNAGTYTVTVTDSKSCPVTATFTVTSTITALSPVTIAGTNVKCKGGSDGSAVVTVSGGCTPYTYAWSGGLTGSSPQGLKAGVYTVTVTDSASPSQSGTATVTITEPANALDITLTGTTEASTSTAADGAINLTIAGGTPNYKTIWSGGIPDGNTSGILEVKTVKAGTYNVTVTDANGCTAVRSGIVVGVKVMPNLDTLPELGPITISSDFNGFGVKCFGDNNGIITGSITKGTYPITITLRAGSQVIGTPVILANPVTIFTFSNLVAGTYTVTATNIKGTSPASAPIVITQPTKLAATPTISCSNKNGETGTIELNMNNSGAGNYGFVWLGQSDLDNKLENLPVGFYNVTITDDNDCELRLSNLEVRPCPLNGDCYIASTVITPNGDNLNDIFKINCVKDNAADLSVYDRWGRLVYAQANYDDTWQGIDKDGNDLKEGAYMWVLNINFGQGRREIYKGTVTLLRAN